MYVVRIHSFIIHSDVEMTKTEENVRKI